MAEAAGAGSGRVATVEGAGRGTGIESTAGAASAAAAGRRRQAGLGLGRRPAGLLQEDRRVGVHRRPRRGGGRGASASWAFSGGTDQEPSTGPWLPASPAPGGGGENDSRRPSRTPSRKVDLRLLAGSVGGARAARTAPLATPWEASANGATGGREDRGDEAGRLQRAAPWGRPGRPRCPGAGSSWAWCVSPLGVTLSLALASFSAGDDARLARGLPVGNLIGAVGHHVADGCSPPSAWAASWSPWPWWWSPSPSSPGAPSTSRRWRCWATGR